MAHWGCRSRGWLLILWLAGSLPAGAEVSSFWVAVDHAQSRNPRIHRKEADLRATVEIRPQRAAKLLPSASFQASKSIYDETTYTRQGRSSTSHATTARVTLNQPLLHVGNHLSFEQSHELVDSARSDLEATRQEVALQVATLVSNWLQAREVMVLGENYQRVTQRHYEVTALRFHAGESTETDVQQSRSRADQAISSLAEAKNTVDQTKAAFRELVGEDPDERISLPLLEWDMDGELKSHEQEGFLERPDMQAVQARLRGADLAVDIQKAEFMPTVDLNFNASRTWDMQLGGSTGISRLDDVETRSLMVILNWPLFNSGESLSKVRQSKAQRDGALADVDVTRKQALKEAQQARADQVHHRSSLEALTLALGSSKAALAGLEEEFLVGTRTLLDLLDAQHEVFTLQTNMVRHRYQEQLARLRLWKALGRSLLNESHGVVAHAVEPQEEVISYPKSQLPEGKSIPVHFPTISDGPFLLQVATFARPEDATSLENSLQAEGIPHWRDVGRTPDDTHVQRILVGPFAEYEQVLDARDFLNQRLQVNAGWIPNPAWKKGMTASYWQDERPLQRKRIGTSYGMARMK